MSHHITAYLDMLGTTSLIKSESSEDARKKLETLYRQVYALAEDQTWGNLKIKIFSDNLLMAQELDGEHDCQIINRFVQSVAAFQFASVYDYSWLLRGGITIGDLHMDDVMAWGDALVRSYELENSVAFFPRIVIDSKPEILHRLYDSGIHANSWLQYDMDAQYFVHYLYGRWGYRNLSAGLSKSFDRLVHTAKRADGTIEKKTFQKLGWHKRYANQFLRTLENARCYLNFPSASAE